MGGRSIPLGRIFGVKVSMDATVLVIAALYTWLLATNRFPIEAPGHSSTAYWVTGTIAALLFFGSLLVHEVGHALVARDEGIGVQGISLWLLGGVARLESSPDNPASELKIAVIGPIASAGCGAAFLAIAYGLPDSGLPGLAGHAAAWLGILNLLLAGFNLLPAAPLDGGTVLSALVWMRTRSHAAGIRWAAYSGLATGIGLFAFGIMRLRGDDAGGFGIMVLLVGAFIASSAWRSLRSIPIIQLLDGLVAADAASPAPAFAHAGSTLPTFLHGLPLGTTQQSFPVVGDDGTIRGVLTASALRAASAGGNVNALRVTDLAYPLDRITIVRAGEPLLAALQKVDSGDVREGLVVADDGHVVGTLDGGTLQRTAQWRASQDAERARANPPVGATAGPYR